MNRTFISPAEVARRLSSFVSNTIFAFMCAVLSAMPAYALSDACSSVNAEWGIKRTFGPVFPQQVYEKPYTTGFNIGETLAWTAAAGGVTAGGMDHSGYFLRFLDTGDIAVKFSDEEPGFSDAGQQTISLSEMAASEFYINVDVLNDTPGSTNTITIQVVCYDNSVPTVTHLSPVGGLTGGGTEVTIEGSGFFNATTVEFGGANATSFTIVSPTKIVAIAPAGSVGTAAVNVTNQYGEASQTRDFRYAELPVIAPAAGALPQGVIGVSYGSTTFSATDGVPSYSFKLANGHSLPPGLSLASGGSITGVPNTVGNYSFTVVVEDSAGLSSSAAYTMTVAELPIAGASSSIVSANSQNTAIALNLSGGAPTSLTVTTQASKGIATVSGTAITYTPNAGYSGADSFQYTATNSAGTSTAATVSLTVTAPTLAIVPGNGALPDATLDVVYSSGAITVSNGMQPYAFALANGSVLPSGLSLDRDTGEISGTPSVFGSFAFSIGITDTNGATGTVNYTLAIAEQLPVAGPVSLTVGGNSTNNTVTLALSGGAAASVDVDTQATNGTATASGTSITYTPNIGYSGPDSFTYTATNSAGDSIPAMVSITVTPPVPQLTDITPNSGSAEGGDTVTIKGSGLTGATEVRIGSWSASSVTVVNDITITAVTPATRAGLHDVVVATPGGSLMLNGAFNSTSVSSAPIPQSISPSSGSTTGGTLVTITGFGFTNATGVYFDGVPASNYTIETDGRITATTPAHLAGRVGFEITSASGDGGITDIYDFVAPVISVTPASGTLAGGQAAVAYSQLFTASGAATPYTYAVTGGSLPAGLQLSSQGLLEGTPTAVGTRSFTITVTDNDGVQQDASYSLDIAPPSLALAPATLPDGTVQGAYSQSFSASGGNGSYSYSHSGTLPPGLSLSSGGVLSGTPTASGTFNFTVEAADSTTGTGAPFKTSSVYSVIVADIVPIAGASSSTVSANSQNEVIALTLSGGAPTSLTITTQASKGIATVSGTAITYTPNAGYSGADSFQYTATNSAGTSAAATVSLTVTAPTLAIVPGNGALPDATHDVVYSSGAIAVSNGMQPYALALANGSVLPSGLSLDRDTGEISGTPSVFGSFAFSIGITDTNGATGTVNYTLAIAEQLPVAGPVSLTVGGNSTNNTVTLALSGGAAALVDVDTQATNGTATASGTSITYTPNIGYYGPDNFTYSATNSSGTSAPATITISVSRVSFSFVPSGGSLPNAMSGEKYSQQIVAAGGTASLRYLLASGTLPDGLALSQSGELSGVLVENTEGPYTFNIEVIDANGAREDVRYDLSVVQRTVTVQNQAFTVPAGGAPPDTRLDRNATGGPFDRASIVSVQPPNAGTVAITMGDYAQAGPVSPVGWYLKFTPASGYSGTVIITFSLESGIGSNTGIVSYTLGYNPAEVVTDIHNLVSGFVKTRQNLLSSGISVPGLLERRRMASGQEPVTTKIRPSARGMTFGFSTSLMQIEASRDASDGIVTDVDITPFNIWIDGKFLFHNRDQNDERWGSFAMISAGADYLISEKVLIGFSAHYDRMTDAARDGSELTGNGWLAGPYTSFEIGRGVFWDASLLYGGSANDIDTAFWDGTFDTTRWMMDTSLKGQWYLDDVTVLIPKLRALYMSESVDAYTIKNDAGNELTIDGFDTEQFRLSLGADITRQFTLENETKIIPKLGVTGGLSGIDGSGAFGSVSAGLALETVEEWNLDFSLLFNIASEGERSAGARAGVTKRF